MAIAATHGTSSSAIFTCVPQRKFDNLDETTEFEPEEAQKVVRMAVVYRRHMASETECSSDLFTAPARRVLEAPKKLWRRGRDSNPR